MTEVYDANYDDESASLDFNRIGLLLMVIKEAILHGSAFTSIIAEANAELTAINADALAIGNDRAKAKAAADAETQAQINAAAQAKAETTVKVAEANGPGTDATATTAIDRRL